MEYVGVDSIRLMNKSACFGHSPAGSQAACLGTVQLLTTRIVLKIRLPPPPLNPPVPLYHTYSADVE